MRAIFYGLLTGAALALVMPDGATIAAALASVSPVTAPIAANHYFPPVWHFSGGNYDLVATVAIGRGFQRFTLDSDLTAGDCLAELADPLAIVDNVADLIAAESGRVACVASTAS